MGQCPASGARGARRARVILRERLVVAMERLMGLILVAVAIEMMLRAAEGLA